MSDRPMRTFLAFFTVLLAGLLAVPAQALPDTPERGYPRYQDGQVWDVVPAPGGMVLTGEPVGTRRLVGKAERWASPIQGRAVLVEAAYVYVGGNGKVSKLRLDDGRRVWTVPVPVGQVQAVEPVPNRKRLLVGGKAGLRIVRTSDGRPAKGRVPPVSKVERLDTHETRVAAIGDLHKSRQIAMYQWHRGDLRNTRWNSVKAQRRCGKKFPRYFRDVEFSPNGRWLVAGSTGGAQYGPRRGYCDAVVTFPARPKKAVKPRSVAFTCADTITSVGWLNNRRVVAAGHQKCQAITGGSRGPWNYQDGLSLIDTKTGDAVQSWTAEKQRCVGSRAVETVPGVGLAIGTDCGQMVRPSWWDAGKLIVFGEATNE